MCTLVLGLEEIKETQLSLVGGKGLNLGKLSKIKGIQVPDGFCVTTVGFQQAINQNDKFQELLIQLTVQKLGVDDYR